MSNWQFDLGIIGIPVSWAMELRGSGQAVAGEGRATRRVGCGGTSPASLASWSDQGRFHSASVTNSKVEPGVTPVASAVTLPIPESPSKRPVPPSQIGVTS